MDNIFKDHRIIFRNFAGEPSRYNAQGNRGFSVIIDQDEADKYKELGWNVKPLRRRDDQEEQMYHIPVAVDFNKSPSPLVFTITESSNGRLVKAKLNENTIKDLDHAYVKKWDISLRPSYWTDDSGVTHIKAYLLCMYAFMENLDVFAEDYGFDDGPGEDESLPF